MASVRSLAVAAVAIVIVVAGFGFRTQARNQDVVQLAAGSTVSLATPAFITAGKRYAFTWAGGGPAQTYTVKALRKDGWIEVEVADETVNPIYFVPGNNPTRWLNVGTAISVQEMRPHQ